MMNKKHLHTTLIPRTNPDTTTLGLEYGSKLMRTYLAHNRLLSPPWTYSLCNKWMMRKRVWKLVNRKNQRLR